MFDAVPRRGSIQARKTSLCELEREVGCAWIACDL